MVRIILKRLSIAKRAGILYYYSTSGTFMYFKSMLVLFVYLIAMMKDPIKCEYLQYQEHNGFP